MNWLQKTASDEFYENMVFSALQKQNLLPAIDALKEHGPRGMDLWVKFKDEFQQNPRLLSSWILESTALVVPNREPMDEIDEWAAKARGVQNRGKGKVPRPDFNIMSPSGGEGLNRSRNQNKTGPSRKYRKHYRHP